MGSGGKLARPGARTPGIYGIFGSEKQAQWTQQTYKRKERFTNPLHQIVDRGWKIEDLPLDCGSPLPLSRSQPAGLVPKPRARSARSSQVLRLHPAICMNPDHR